jgi:hypothetical protein
MRKTRFGACVGHSASTSFTCAIANRKATGLCGGRRNREKVNHFTFFSPDLAYRCAIESNGSAAAPGFTIRHWRPVFISDVLRVSAQFWCLPKRNGRLRATAGRSLFCMSATSRCAQFLPKG